LGTRKEMLLEYSTQTTSSVFNNPNLTAAINQQIVAIQLVDPAKIEITTVSE